jgi:hypothetical protein
MADAGERIVPLGEKLMAVLAEHDSGEADQTLADRLSAISYAAGRTLADHLQIGEQRRAILGATMFAEQVVGHVVTRWDERARMVN